MAGVFDSTFLRHRVNEAFNVNHAVADSIHHRFEHHHERATEWRQHGPIFVHHTDEGPTLVKFELTTDVDAARRDLDQLIDSRLKDVRAVLEGLTKPDEEYHLTVEERPEVGDVPTNRVTYYIKGIIVPKGTM